MKQYWENLKYCAKKLWWCLGVPFKIDVHVVEHCNLNCKGCFHFSPLAKAEFLDPAEFETNLRILTKHHKIIDTFQLLGGEPLLHPQLAKLTDLSRCYLPSSKITIITNGVLLARPDKLPPNFWESCRKNDVTIKLTVYPINLDLEKIKDICNQQGVKLEFFKDKSVRWSFFPLYEKGYYHKLKKFRVFKSAYCASLNCFQLVGNRIYPCSHIAYIRHLNSAFNKNFVVDEKDYIEIENLKNSCQLRKQLIFAVPFCRHCGFGCEKSDWGVSRHDEKEWVR